MSIPESMTALVVTAPGDGSVLAVQDRPVPTPGPDQLLARVAAAGVNFIDVYQREGAYPTPTPFVLGMEGAGHIVALGDRVEGFAVGQLVAWPFTAGSMAQYAVVPAARAVPVPEGVGAVTAGAAMLQGLTAHYLVTSTHPVQPGDVCVVTAAAGGVGQLLVRMITARGGRVIATAGSRAKCDIALALGAEAAIDTSATPDLATALRELAPEGAHVVYDGVGLATWEASLAALRPRGLFCLFGAASGPVPPFDLQRLNAGGSLFATRPTLGDYIATTEDLRWRAGELFDDLASGRITLEATAIPLADAAAAYAALEGRRTTGKLVLVP